MPDPGFRWNVLDYGKGNILADALRHSSGGAPPRCSESHAAWHCLWQRFPHQRAGRSAPPPDSALGTAADELYNLSRSGRANPDPHPHPHPHPHPNPDPNPDPDPDPNPRQMQREVAEGQQERLTLTLTLTLN